MSGIYPPRNAPTKWHSLFRIVPCLLTVISICYAPTAIASEDGTSSDVELPNDYPFTLESWPVKDDHVIQSGFNGVFKTVGEPVLLREILPLAPGRVDVADYMGLLHFVETKDPIMAFAVVEQETPDGIKPLEAVVISVIDNEDEQFLMIPTGEAENQGDDGGLRGGGGASWEPLPDEEEPTPPSPAELAIGHCGDEPGCESEPTGSGITACVEASRCRGYICDWAACVNQVEHLGEIATRLGPRGPGYDGCGLVQLLEAAACVHALF